MALFTIGGTPVTLVPNSLNIVDSIGQRSVANFTVLDTAGAFHFVCGQPILITDNTGLVVYAGEVADAIRGTASSYSNMLLHQITGADWHLLADKRIAATSYASRTCGYMFLDLLTNYLWAEGVGYLNNLLTVNQSNVETNTTGFAAVHAATLTQDTAQAWQGTHSLKCVTPNVVAGEGWQATQPLTSYHPGDVLVLSTYLYGAGTVQVECVRTDTGAVIGSPVAATLAASWTRYSVAITLPTTLPTSGQIGLQVVTTSQQAATFWADGLQIEQAYAATPWVVGQTSYIQAGPLVTSYVVNYKQVSVAYDDLAKLAGFYWVIDFAKVAHFAGQATNAAPWTFDGTVALDDGSATIEDTNPLYRNAQYMLGAVEITSPQTETQHGDGTIRVFPTSYNIHQTPTHITVNGGADQTVGILGVGAPGSAQWYWNKGKAQITQDSSGTVLLATDTLSITYIGEYQVVAYATDTAGQIGELAIEGAGTGIYENVVADASLITAAQAFQNANALLTKFSTTGQILLFTTKKPGLQAGQLLNVNLPMPWHFAAQVTLIETITITFDDFNFWYQVKADVGPVNSNWVQFFQALANVQTPIDLASSGALQQTVAILAAFTLIWSWAMNFTATVYVCPICGPSTFCGLSTICC
jgi:hypothetical protein